MATIFSNNVGNFQVLFSKFVVLFIILLMRSNDVENMDKIQLVWDIFEWIALFPERAMPFQHGNASQHTF